MDSCVKKRYELLCFYVFDNFRPFGRTVRQGWPYPTNCGTLWNIIIHRWVNKHVGCGLHRRTVDTIVAINLLNNCYMDSCVKRRYELLCLYGFDNFRPIGRTVRQGWPYPTIYTATL